MLKTKTQEKNKTITHAKGYVRIIAGKFKGRKLEVINQPGLRPTGDRMKETLFNWLMNDIHNSQCLDLFAGSGSLGFEAASRGASSVTFIDNNKHSVAILNKNIQLLKSNNIVVQHQDAFDFIKSPPKKPFDIIFLDPPFNKGMLDQILFELLDNHFIAQEGLIYIESERTNPLDRPPSLKVMKEKISGQVLYQLLRRFN